MATTIKPTVKQNARADKTHAVRIRITQNRKTCYYNTGIYIPNIKQNWNARGSYERANYIKSGVFDFQLYNTAIANLVGKFTALALSAPHLTPNELIQAFAAPPPSEPDLLKFLEREINRVGATLSPGYAAILRGLKNKLSEFFGGSLPVSRFTLPAVRDFVLWLQTKKNNSPVTVRVKINMLRTVAKMAVSENYISYSQNPMPYVTVSGKLPAPKTPLSASQLLQLKTIPAPYPAKISAVARDLFFLQFLCHGARGGDMVALKWANVGETVITFQMRKNKKPVRVARSVAIDEILAKYETRRLAGFIYVFPLLKCTDALNGPFRELQRNRGQVQRVNKYLKKFAETAGWAFDLRTHTARRTFASLARGAADLREIQALLNHSTLATTEKYLSALQTDQIDAAAARVYGKILVKQ
jgi:integrase